MPDETKEEVKEEVKEETKEVKEEVKETTKETSGDDELTEKIRKVVSEMLPSRPGLGGTRVDMEAMAARMVEEASQKLQERQKVDGIAQTVEELKEQVKEKAEETPRKVKRLTKALWGDEK